MPIAKIEMPAGTYDTDIDGTLGTVTVPVLTSGSIAQASPVLGDVLTVSGSNASGDATFQWQESADGSTGWADISGATSESIDTSSGVTGDYFVRRGVSDGLQGPIYTSGVEVAASAAVVPTFTRIASGSDGNNVNPGNAGPLFSGIDLSAIPTGDEVMIVLMWTDSGSGGTMSLPTLGGVTPSVISGTSTNGGTALGYPEVELYRMTMPSGSGILDLQIGTPSTASMWSMTYWIYHVENRTADLDTDIQQTALGEGSVTTVADGSVFAAMLAKDTDNDAASPTFTNLTKDGADIAITNETIASVAKLEGTTAGTLAVTSPRPANADQSTLVVLSVS